VLLGYRDSLFAGGFRLVPVPQTVPWPRFQPLPIRTAREVFPQAAHPMTFTIRVMGPLASGGHLHV